ncbi:M28 family metallopeptidase [Deminuibacter soli]|uniref:Peptidase M28 n=1 Tax=Deminuibacter soli TaxID=2291815 RepID=A0A3E1NIY3_9BACT|nr:M28 family metallopeptidase [Deminuibacter soli]RFM27895.1 peptidase M28 [Deminuibacter soli]
MRTIYLFIAILAATAAGCSSKPQQTDVQQAAAAITDTGFARYIQTLASDSFEGRKPFTPGEDKTIHYLEQQFKQLGLQPGNGGSYFQDVPMVDIFSKPAGALVVKGKTGSVTLNYPDDYVAATRRVQDEVSVNNSPLVFAGYGIIAPEYNWNDYAGLDVKGKTVVVMVNDPGFNDSTLFRGKNMTYYGRWTYKFEEAARQGATGLMIIHDTKPASYPWGVIRSGWTGSKLYLQAEDNNMSRAVMEGWMTTDAAKKLFQLAGKPDSLLQQAGRKGFKPVELGITTSLVIHNTIKKSVSHNVLAVWPGDSKKDEYLIYSAHWDHLGVGEKVNGDSIYNGAGDNATGTAALLEMAAAFTKLKKKPARSVLFAAVTAEEQGLLGSEYYATHPVVPVKKTVADINIDVLQPFGKMKDIVVIGYGQSELDDYAQQAAAQQGRVIRQDPDPAAGHYFRSDHFNFAKVGIPALYTENGQQSVAHGEEWGKQQLEEYNKNRYHAPGDEFKADWDMTGIVQDAQLLFNVGYRLTNETSFPQWKPGSEFKAVRERQ